MLSRKVGFRRFSLIVAFVLSSCLHYFFVNSLARSLQDRVEKPSDKPLALSVIIREHKEVSERPLRPESAVRSEHPSGVGGTTPSRARASGTATPSSVQHDLRVGPLKRNGPMPSRAPLRRGTEAVRARPTEPEEDRRIELPQSAQEPASAPPRNGGRGEMPERSTPSLRLRLDGGFRVEPSLAEQARTRGIDSAPAPAATSGLGRAGVLERRHSDGRVDAKINGRFGSYCLRGKAPGAATLSDRPFDRSVLPTNCD